MNEPIVLGHYFEVKIKNRGSMTAWEDLKPTLVICLKDSPAQAFKDYMSFLINEDIDLSEVQEFRVNRFHSLQGHYYMVQDFRHITDED
jgi:hypothetical protein